MTEVSASVACSHSTRLECTYNSPLTPPHLHHHNPLTCLLLPIFLDPLQLFCSCFRWENSSTCVHFKYWGWGVWERKNCDIIVHLLQILSNKHFVSRIYTFPFFVNAWTESLFFSFFFFQENSVCILYFWTCIFVHLIQCAHLRVLRNLILSSSSLIMNNLWCPIL